MVGDGCDYMSVQFSHVLPSSLTFVVSQCSKQQYQGGVEVRVQLC